MEFCFNIISLGASLKSHTEIVSCVNRNGSESIGCLPLGRIFYTGPSRDLEFRENI